MKIYNSHSQPVLSISLFFQNNNNFDQSDLFLSKKHNIDWEALFSISSEVSNDWLPFSCVVYNLQSVQADKSFSSNELLNSRRERYNRRRDCFSAGWNSALGYLGQLGRLLFLHYLPIWSTSTIINNNRVGST